MTRKVRNPMFRGGSLWHKRTQEEAHPQEPMRRWMTIEEARLFYRPVGSRGAPSADNVFLGEYRGWDAEATRSLK